MLEYLDAGELFAEGIYDVKASLLSVLPEDEVLNVNKAILSLLFDEIIAQATFFYLLDKEVIAPLILHELDNFIQLDWLLSNELAIKVKPSSQRVNL